MVRDGTGMCRKAQSIAEVEIPLEDHPISDHRNDSIRLNSL